MLFHQCVCYKFRFSIVSSLYLSRYPPGSLFDRRHEFRAPVPPPPPAPQPQAQQVVDQPQRRCRCEECTEMPTAVERKCCREEPLDKTHIPDYDLHRCLRHTAAVQHLLNPITIQLLWLDQRRYQGFTGPALSFDNMTNRNYRFHCYRAYINYIHGKLGRFNREIIPACIVSLIRDQWSEESGEYVGFTQVDEDGQPIPADELLDGFCKFPFHHHVADYMINCYDKTSI